MKTIGRAAWPWLLLAATCGCGKYRLEVHYVQLENCQTWSDQNDDPEQAFVNPLVVYRLVSVKNTGSAAVPYDLQNVFIRDLVNGEDNHPTPTNIPSFGDIGGTLNPGVSRQFPQPRISGLFALTPVDGTDNVEGSDFFLLYDNSKPLPSGDFISVLMVRDPSPKTYYPYRGLTALSGIQ
jgi:hypothetical protein